MFLQYILFLTISVYLMNNVLSRKAKLKAHTAYFKNFKPCGSCCENCSGDDISCSICRKTFHSKCLGLSKERSKTHEQANSLICSIRCFNSQLPFYFGDNIDFLSALFGEGEYPCKKCKRDCLDNMDCISCSACGSWHHFDCTKLSEHEFKTKTYFFCNKRCENSVRLPTDNTDSNEISEENSCCCDQSAKTLPLTEKDKEEEKRMKKINEKNIINRKPISKHFLDVKCSYLDPNLINNFHLSNDNSELVIFHNNVRSLNKNFCSIGDIFQDCDKLPDILAVSETWLNKDSFIPQIENYIFENVDTPPQVKSDIGGVGMYISNELDYTIREDLSLGHKGCEDLWIDINLRNRIPPKTKNITKENLVVGVIYHHPDQGYEAFSESLSRTLHILNKNKTNYVIVGDINLDTEKYNLTSNASNYLNNLCSFGCNMFINKPTRVTSKTATCIDHVYANLSATNIENHIILSDVSDHYATLTKVSGLVREHKHEIIYRRKSHLNENEWKNFNEELKSTLSVKLSRAGNISDPNEVAVTITKTYQILLDKYMPLKKLSRKQKRYFSKPWITPAIKVSIRKKNKLFKISKRKNDAKITAEYKRYRNLLTRTKSKAYENYYREKLIEYGQDKSKTWRLINEISKRKRNEKRSIKNMVCKNGVKLESRPDIAEYMNTHFASVGKSMAAEYENPSNTNLLDPLEYKSNKPSHLMYLSKTVLSEIKDLIQNLDEKKSCGFDQISNKVLKASCSVIAPFLEKLFNLCLSRGIFPEQFKIAKVIPLHKGGTDTARIPTDQSHYYQL